MTFMVFSLGKCFVDLFMVIWSHQSHRLVLMTYQGVVLLLSGYQADEQRLLREYKAVVDKIEARYPNGALWILNRVSDV